jgi:hypothetical protein
MDVDGKSLNKAGFWIGVYLPVDRMLIGMHESNPRSN